MCIPVYFSHIHILLQSDPSLAQACIDSEQHILLANSVCELMVMRRHCYTSIGLNKSLVLHSHPEGLLCLNLFQEGKCIPKLPYQCPISFEAICALTSFYHAHGDAENIALLSFNLLLMISTFFFLFMLFQDEMSHLLSFLSQFSMYFCPLLPNAQMLFYYLVIHKSLLLIIFKTYLILMVHTLEKEVGRFHSQRIHIHAFTQKKQLHNLQKN